MKRIIIAAAMSAFTCITASAQDAAYSITNTESLPTTQDNLYNNLVTEKPAPGKLFTDMTINDISGQPRQLSEWIGKGQYVMIDFWASWCGPCRQEMPNVVRNYEKYHPAGFEIIGISFDQREANWKSAVNQLQMAWPQLSDLRGWQSAAAYVYGITSIPASILFDKEGRIIAINLRGQELGQKLQELYDF